MAKMDKKALVRDAESAAIVKKVARIHGVSDDLVYKVVRGDRDNEAVLVTYMNLMEAELKMEENELKKAVRKLVPFK